VSVSHTARTAARLVEIELLPLADLADTPVGADAGRYAARSLALAGPHIRLALTLAVLGLDVLTVLRHGRPFTKVRTDKAAAWWTLLSGYPGFAHLRQLVRTPAMLRFSERIRIDRNA
jgi:hypothetical protein